MAAICAGAWTSLWHCHLNARFHGGFSGCESLLYQHTFAAQQQLWSPCSLCLSGTQYNTMNTDWVPYKIVIVPYMVILQEKIRLALVGHESTHIFQFPGLNRRIGSNLS